ncbi:GntR family transcriptional regulator [Taklimakanibacter lacteus]|uniref:GntR family transcriptional regulator n=1 Tax=Taklimakanibacter lacteus TaxID=2268456 RepID=UPI0034D4C31B
MSDSNLALMQAPLEQVEARSLTDRVYHQMRDRLMRGILKPHQRLRIGELSKTFGISETPIREAIFQLVRDGAVEAKPHSYFRVRKLSVAEYVERREIRLLLEPLAAERALDNISDADIDRLASHHQRLIAAEANREWDPAVRANFDFHFGLYRGAKMPQLITMLENLWLQHGPLLNFLYPDGHPTYDGRHQHEHIVEALRARDREALRAAVHADLVEGGRNFLRHLQELEKAEKAGEDA